MRVKLLARNFSRPRRITDPAQFAHAAIIESTFDDFISEQCQHSSAHEKRPRVSIPVYARSATPIVHCRFRSGGEFTDFLEMQRIVVQEQDCRRRIKQMAITGTARYAYRQAECAGVWSVRLVKEAMTAQFTLRRAFARVAIDPIPAYDPR